MAYNIPNFDTTRLSFGPGILYMGVPGTTPLLDIGSVTGDASLSVERKVLAVMQGSPQTLIKQYCVEESVSLKVTGIEWNTSNLAYFMGAGVTTQTGATEQIDFGGDFSFNNRALRFLHIMPDGGTFDLHLFNAYSAGKVTFDFKTKESHQIPLEFNGFDGSTDFQGVALGTTKKKFRILRTKA